jgi:hypothetical protein
MLDYNQLLTSEQKLEILKNRLTQFASEAYQVNLNLQTAEKVAEPDQIQKIRDNLKLLETAIGVHQEEIARLS